MTDRVAAIVEQLSQQNPFNGTEGLPDPPRPSEAAIPRDRPTLEQIPYIQQQISILTYNHLPRTFFSLEKHRSLQSILMTAKEALTEALPIRCLEATFIALHFTQCLRDVDRIPLSFKSEANGSTYRHIVLILRTRATPSLYGALGLSRKSTLMYKPMIFRSLFDVVMDYKHEYEVLGHELVDIKLGIAITHDERSRLDPCWRFIALKLRRYCDNANGSVTAKAEVSEAASPTTIAHRKQGSPNTPPTRKSGGQSSEAFSRTPNGDSMRFISSSSSFDTAPRGEIRVPSSRGEGHLERSQNGVLSESLMKRPPRNPHRTSSLGAAASNLSPGPTSALPNKSDSSVESYAPLAKLLANYAKLLPTICEQYYATIGNGDSTNRALKLCYMDLDTAEKDAGMENQRRLQCIADLQSPLSAEARRVAANRQLCSTKKENAHSKQSGVASGCSGDINSIKRRQANSNEGRPAKRRAPASSTPQRNGSPRTRSTPTTAGGTTTTTTASNNTSASAMPVPSSALAAALADSAHTPRNPLFAGGIVVDAHSICSSTSAEQTVTEGYVTPLATGRTAGKEQEMPDVPSLTPHNYDSRKPTTPYDAFLRTPSSTSDLFSGPTSLSNTLSAQVALSP